MSNFYFLIFLTFTYLLGSVSWAILICKFFKKPDPRQFGSHNPGATNVLRVAGKPFALLVLLLDLAKGSLPILLANYFAYPKMQQTIIALVAVLGHIFPIFFHFKGGKGVATAFGALIVLSPSSAGACLLVFLILLTTCRIVAVGSIFAAIFTPFVFHFFEHINSPALFLTALIVVIKHHTNIRKILKN